MKKVPMAVVVILLLLFCLLLIMIENTSATLSNQQHGLSDELRFLHREIGLLEEENQNQNIEISLLKEMVTESHQQQQIKKRPARLLPARFLYGVKNYSNSQPAIRTFYGPPTNCTELSRLGYTLNGFYLVKPNGSKITDDSTQLETVYCAFKQPAGTFKESKVEKRVFAKIKVKNDGEKARRKAEIEKIQWNIKLKENEDDDFQYQERTTTYKHITYQSIFSSS